MTPDLIAGEFPPIVLRSPQPEQVKRRERPLSSIQGTLDVESVLNEAQAPQELKLLNDPVGTGFWIRIEVALLIREIPRKQMPNVWIDVQFTPASEGSHRGSISTDARQRGERVSFAMNNGGRRCQRTNMPRWREIGRGAAALQQPCEPAITHGVERR